MLSHAAARSARRSPQPVALASWARPAVSAAIMTAATTAGIAAVMALRLVYAANQVPGFGRAVFPGIFG
ncbi:hypothetical protein [Marinivivus vitaminiproducens]|uniref:hypothetical protein n=1 Tax=Marinivivus vitaminiproducens TaxID=3035935 RepID=UPI00279B2A2B|nr:hypothetical protein P4R82_14690 [Geminicoccaceae bacterium SCSIO 64248]